MTEFIADVASYQHGLDLKSLRPDCVGVEIKCTEGATYANPDYPGWLAQARANGLLTIAYHYVNTDPPAAQAANLAAHILDKTVPVMLDVEAGAGSWPNILAVTDAMTAAGLGVRLFYLPEFFWQRLGSPSLVTAMAARRLSLVSAHYPSATAGSPAGLYPGDTSLLWAGYGGVDPVLLQFASTALQGGQQVDMNAYRGTTGELAALLAPTITQQENHMARLFDVQPGPANTTDAPGIWAAVEGIGYVHVGDPGELAAFRAGNTPEGAISYGQHQLNLAAAVKATITLTDAQVAQLGAAIAAGLKIPTAFTGTLV